MGNDLDVAHFCRISLRCARARPAVFVEPGFAAAAVLLFFVFHGGVAVLAMLWPLTSSGLLLC